MTTDWLAWHEQYRETGPLTQRLALVRGFIRETLDAAPAGPVRALSMCAGDGRDLLGVLMDHPRRADVHARLVELDPVLAARARDQAGELGLTGVEIVCADAANTDVYADIVPVDLALVCGVFGNITDADIRNVVTHLPQLCAKAAHVIWTRGTFEPDLTPAIRRWLQGSGFEEVAFERVPGATAAAGHNVFRAEPHPFQQGLRLFTFLPDNERPARRAQV